MSTLKIATDKEIEHLEDRLASGSDAKTSLLRFRAMLVENKRRAWLDDEDFASWLEDWTRIAWFVEREVSELKARRETPAVAERKRETLKRRMKHTQEIAA